MFLPSCPAGWTAANPLQVVPTLISPCIVSRQEMRPDSEVLRSEAVAGSDGERKVSETAVSREESIYLTRCRAVRTIETVATSRRTTWATAGF